MLSSLDGTSGNIDDFQIFNLRHAQHALWASTRIIAERGGAATLAALLSGGYAPAPGERVGVLMSGANTTAVEFEASKVQTG